MKRWNGWGDVTVKAPVTEAAQRYLEAHLGRGARILDAPFESVVEGAPSSRLAPHPLVTTDPVERVQHARGQSLPDWIALRSGRIGTFPDGVAFPTSEADVRALLEYARETRARLIPYGGGTSVVGHINPLAGDQPTCTLDLTRLNKLLALDQQSHLATFGTGVTGPELEAQLAPYGLVLGHYPQSYEYSTLGGWIATRSSGQQSYYYGRIEALLAGAHVETPSGPMELAAYPASAAGPDLKHLLLGSEGRLGVITRAVVRVRSIPEVEMFYGAFFRHWEAGAEAIREAAQTGVRASMFRLSDAVETETTFALAGHGRTVEWAERGLSLAGYPAPRCLFIFGVTGERGSAEKARVLTNKLIRRHGGLPVQAVLGPMWAKTRFRTPYLRNSLWELGYALDTLETALPWSALLPAAEAILRALREGLAKRDERVLAFAHLSQGYNDGASLYVTYLYRRSLDPDETLENWRTLKCLASAEIVARGGTISHQHGVGMDHIPYLAAEKGPLGIAMLEAACRTVDPDHLMNPNKLLP